MKNEYEDYERYMKKETKVFEVDTGVWNER